MRRAGFTLMLLTLTCPVGLAATVYKWVDENGVVHYSDQPHPNAQKLQIEGAQTFPAAALRSGAPPPQARESPSSSANPYQGCAIQQPADGETYQNTDTVGVAVVTDPSMRPGDNIYLTMDGQPVNGGSPTGPAFRISGVDRGTHSLQAQVRDGAGQVVCQTPSITFYVHQPSLLNPANPVRPH
jgi:hypothetical protein